MNLIPKFSYHTEEVHKCLQKPTARDKNVRRIKRNFKLKHYNEIFFRSPSVTHERTSGRAKALIELRVQLARRPR